VAQFFHDQVAFGDAAGFGIWRLEHAYEHTQFVQLLAARSPPLLLSDYPFFDWFVGNKGFQTTWLDTHQRVHDFLRQVTGVGGPDLDDVDFDEPQQWYDWHGAHATEHANLRAAFGIA
jgi:hypothetical protein